MRLTTSFYGILKDRGPATTNAVDAGNERSALPMIQPTMSNRRDSHLGIICIDCVSTCTMHM